MYSLGVRVAILYFFIEKYDVPSHPPLRNVWKTALQAKMNAEDGTNKNVQEWREPNSKWPPKTKEDNAHNLTERRIIIGHKC